VVEVVVEVVAILDKRIPEKLWHHNSTTSTMTMTMTVAELEAACHAHAQLEGCEHFLTIYDELTDEGLARANTSCGQVEFEELRRAFFTYYLTLVHDENPSGSIDEKNDRKRKRKGCEEGCEHSKETKAWLQSSQEA